MSMPPPPPPGGPPPGASPPGGPPYQGVPPQLPPPGGPPGPASDTPQVLGIVSLVSGLVGLVAACCCWIVGWIFPVVALVTGIIGLVQLKDRPSSSSARPLLIIGIVLGVLGLILVVFSAVWGAATVFSGNTPTWAPT